MDIRRLVSGLPVKVTTVAEICRWAISGGAVTNGRPPGSALDVESRGRRG